MNDVLHTSGMRNSHQLFKADYRCYGIQVRHQQDLGRPGNHVGGTIRSTTTGSTVASPWPPTLSGGQVQAQQQQQAGL
jgi:hypothetical protein